MELKSVYDIDDDNDMELESVYDIDDDNDMELESVYDVDRFVIFENDKIKPKSMLCPMCDIGVLYRQVIQATCTRLGSVTTTCNRCSYKTQSSTQMLPHDYSNVSGYYCTERVKCRNCASRTSTPGSLHRNWSYDSSIGRNRCDDCKKTL